MLNRQNVLRTLASEDFNARKIQHEHDAFTPSNAEIVRDHNYFSKYSELFPELRVVPARALIEDF